MIKGDHRQWVKPVLVGAASVWSSLRPVTGGLPSQMPPGRVERPWKQGECGDLPRYEFRPTHWIRAARNHGLTRPWTRDRTEGQRVSGRVLPGIRVAASPPPTVEKPEGLLDRLAIHLRVVLRGAEALVPRQVPQYQCIHLTSPLRAEGMAELMNGQGLALRPQSLGVAIGQGPGHGIAQLPLPGLVHRPVLGTASLPQVPTDEFGGRLGLEATILIAAGDEEDLTSNWSPDLTEASGDAASSDTSARSDTARGTAE